MIAHRENINCSHDLPPSVFARWWCHRLVASSFRHKKDSLVHRIGRFSGSYANFPGKAHYSFVAAIARSRVCVSDSGIFSLAPRDGNDIADARGAVIAWSASRQVANEKVSERCGQNDRHADQRPAANAVHRARGRDMSHITFRNRFSNSIDTVITSFVVFAGVASCGSNHLFRERNRQTREGANLRPKKSALWTGKFPSATLRRLPRVERPRTSWSSARAATAQRQSAGYPASGVPGCLIARSMRSLPTSSRASFDRRAA